MKKFISLFLVAVSLIALARMLTKKDLPTVADFLAMTQGVGTFDPGEVFQECNQIVKDMLILDASGFGEIWKDVDWTNFLVKLADSLFYLLTGVVSFICGVFLSSLNLLKIPLQGLLFVLSIVYWVFGIKAY